LRQGTIFKDNVKVELVPALHHGVSKEHIGPRGLLQPEQAAFDPPRAAEFLLTLLATTRSADAMSC